MSFYKYFLTGLSVAALSLAYNFFVFQIFDFYPDSGVFLPILRDGGIELLYALIFVRGLLLGMILMYLFAHGANSLESISADLKDDVKTVFFFASYGLVSLVVFTLGDFVLMRSAEGFLLLLTVDSLIESLIALIPIRMFYVSWFKKPKKVDI